jgi:hypothetical protein
MGVREGDEQRQYSGRVEKKFRSGFDNKLLTLPAPLGILAHDSTLNRPYGLQKKEEILVTL